VEDQRTQAIEGPFTGCWLPTAGLPELTHGIEKVCNISNEVVEMVDLEVEGTWQPWSKRGDKVVAMP